MCSKEHPKVSFYTYVIFPVFKGFGSFDTKQDGFLDHVYSEGFDYFEIRQELLNTGIVMDLDSFIYSSYKLYCGEVIINEEVEEFIAVEWDSSLQYAMDRLWALDKMGINAQIKVPLTEKEQEESGEHTLNIKMEE